MGNVIPGYFGEFGLAIRYFIPHVAALCSLGRYTVEIEEGQEALYPFAAEWKIMPRPHDDERNQGPGERFPQKRFVPEPHIRQGIKCDVVIAPRKRNHGSAKNWPHWEALTELPNVFAAGAPDSSYDLQVPRSWDYARFLDASIEAIRSARLVIATDAGLAHLAVLCGTPLLMVTYRGLVAPGPVEDAHGHRFQEAYWPCKWEEYYTSVNHTGTHLEMIDGWERPERVLRRAKEIIGA